MRERTGTARSRHREITEHALFLRTVIAFPGKSTPHPNGDSIMKTDVMRRTIIILNQTFTSGEKVRITFDTGKPITGYLVGWNDSPDPIISLCRKNDAEDARLSRIKKISRLS
jgi:hypothetical protein